MPIEVHGEELYDMVALVMSLEASSACLAFWSDTMTMKLG